MLVVLSSSPPHAFAIVIAAIGFYEWSISDRIIDHAALRKVFASMFLPAPGPLFHWLQRSLNVYPEQIVIGGACRDTVFEKAVFSLL